MPSLAPLSKLSAATASLAVLRSTAQQVLIESHTSSIYEKTLQEVECGEPRLQYLKIPIEEDVRVIPEFVWLNRCQGNCNHNRNKKCVAIETNTKTVAFKVVSGGGAHCYFWEAVEHTKCSCFKDNGENCIDHNGVLKPHCQQYISKSTTESSTLWTGRHIRNTDTTTISSKEQTKAPIEERAVADTKTSNRVWVSTNIIPIENESTDKMRSLEAPSDNTDVVTTDSLKKTVETNTPIIHQIIRDKTKNKDDYEIPNISDYLNQRT